MESSTEDDSFCTNCEYNDEDLQTYVYKETNQRITIDDELIQAFNYNNLEYIDDDDDDLQTDVNEETDQQIIPNIFDIVYGQVPISSEKKKELEQNYIIDEYSKADEVKVKEHYITNNYLEYDDKGDEEDENENEIDEMEEDHIMNNNNLEYDDDEGNGENEDEIDEIE